MCVGDVCTCIYMHAWRVHACVMPYYGVYSFYSCLLEASDNKICIQDNISVSFIPPYTPLLYSKTGVYRGIHYFLIFALKHILWVPTIYVLSKI